MSAEPLRRAAKLMRERAEAVPHSPWSAVLLGGKRYPQRVLNPEAVLIAEIYEDPAYPPAMAEHIASWHPAVALAVADVLALVGPAITDGTVAEGSPIGTRCAAVARLYLGEVES